MKNQKKVSVLFCPLFPKDMVFVKLKVKYRNSGDLNIAASKPRKSMLSATSQIQNMSNIDQIQNMRLLQEGHYHSISGSATK